MSKSTVHTNQAPKAVGPYSQAIKVSGSTFIFTAGQVALDPATMNIVGATAADQCGQVMKNLQAVLKAAGADFSNVVKTTIYLISMSDFAQVNAVYEKFFEGDPPARSTVAVSELPKNALIEIDMIAVID